LFRRSLRFRRQESITRTALRVLCTRRRRTPDQLCTKSRGGAKVIPDPGPAQVRNPGGTHAIRLDSSRRAGTGMITAMPCLSALILAPAFAEGRLCPGMTTRHGGKSSLQVFHSCAMPPDVLSTSRLRSQFQLLSHHDHLVRLARQRSDAGNVLKCDRVAWYEINRATYQTNR
jgi:hypothetical protein